MSLRRGMWVPDITNVAFPQRSMKNHHTPQLRDYWMHDVPPPRIQKRRSRLSDVTQDSEFVVIILARWMEQPSRSVGTTLHPTSYSKPSMSCIGESGCPTVRYNDPHPPFKLARRVKANCLVA
ncbi:hypothetical protein [Rhodopirellula bahusiensis]|uniref:hypothetical protein n=1 Tax=Rhodopirellula bahusiensis TaxID=2014065 RepID=UPI003264FC6B